MDTKKKVKSIVASALHLSPIDDEARQSDFAEWDSMAYLAIVSALEKEFGIKVNYKNIGRFDSVQSIVKEIKRAKKQHS